jgi:ABC-2 type transport system ATP-binding protein
LTAVEKVERVGAGDALLRARLYVTGEPARLVAAVSDLVTQHQGRLTEVRLGEPSLEDVFIHLTGRALR